MKIIDLHCDTLFKFSKNPNYSFSENDGHITEKGLLLGGYMAQCFAIYTPAKIYGEDAYHYFCEQYNRFINNVNKSTVLEFAKSKSDITANSKNGKVSAVLTVENAELFNQDINRINVVQKNNVMVLGLIHNGENCLGFPHSFDNKLNNLPLKPFGREVVDALNSTDITIDVSHLNYGGFCDVAEISKKPFIATHSACRNILDHSRNLYDDQIVKIAKSGGIVGVAFYSNFLNGTNKTNICDIISHIEHLINIGGEDIVALGTDFDGMTCNLFLQDCSGMQLLTDALIKKFGYNVAEKICYKNALRIL